MLLAKAGMAISSPPPITDRLLVPKTQTLTLIPDASDPAHSASTNIAFLFIRTEFISIIHVCDSTTHKHIR